jgi:hypothetical protein
MGEKEIADGMVDYAFAALDMKSADHPPAAA